MTVSLRGWRIGGAGLKLLLLCLMVFEPQAAECGDVMLLA